MEDIVNNSWFIGIIGGWISAILSGSSALLVTYIFTTLMRKKRIESANQFLIDHLRQYIIKGVIPSETLANALRLNAAKRFRVRENDLLSLPNIIAELVAEIVDGLYLQEENRMQYLQTIDEYLSDHPQSSDDSKKFVRQVLSISMVLTFLTSSVILTFAIEFIKLDPDQFSELFVQIQNADIFRKFVAFLFLAEMIFITLFGIPTLFGLIVRDMSKIIGNGISFLKKYLPYKGNNS